MEVLLQRENVGGDTMLISKDMALSMPAHFKWQMQLKVLKGTFGMLNLALSYPSQGPDVGATLLTQICCLTALSEARGR